MPDNDTIHQAALQRMQIDLAEAGARIVTLERVIEQKDKAHATLATYAQQLMDEKRTAESKLRQLLHAKPVNDETRGQATGAPSHSLGGN